MYLKLLDEFRRPIDFLIWSIEILSSLDLPIVVVVTQQVSFVPRTALVQHAIPQWPISFEVFAQ